MSTIEELEARIEKLEKKIKFLEDEIAYIDQANTSQSIYFEERIEYLENAQGNYDMFVI